MDEKTKRLIRYPSRIPVRSIDDLRTIVGKEKFYDYAIILFKNNDNTGIGAEYYWEGDNRDVHDGWDVVRPLSVEATKPGRWLRVKRADMLRTRQWSFNGNSPGGTTTQWEFTHNWNNKNVIIQVTQSTSNDNSYDQQVDVNIGRSTNKILISFRQPPIGNTYSVLATEITKTT